MRCCVCGFNGTEKYSECPRCYLKEKYGRWVDMRCKKDREIFASHFHGAKNLKSTEGEK
jgi:hypothetical protein